MRYWCERIFLVLVAMQAATMPVEEANAASLILRWAAIGAGCLTIWGVGAALGESDARAVPPAIAGFLEALKWHNEWEVSDAGYRLTHTRSNIEFFLGSGLPHLTRPNMPDALTKKERQILNDAIVAMLNTRARTMSSRGEIDNAIARVNAEGAITRHPS